MFPISPQPINDIVLLHAEEAVHLANLRPQLLNAPHIKLFELARADERLAAHIDGLRVAGDLGYEYAALQLELPSYGALLLNGVLAIERKDQDVLDQLLGLTIAAPELDAGLLAAFAWVSSQHLRGTVAAWLNCDEVAKRRIALLACLQHGVSPGKSLLDMLTDDHAALRAAALQTVGELGLRDLLPACLAAVADHDLTCRFHAVRAATLLGAGQQVLAVWSEFALSNHPFQAEAVFWLLQLLSLDEAQQWLRPWAQNSQRQRLLIQAIGWSGNAKYLLWLLKQMADESVARVAAEAFSLISGLDLFMSQLERAAPGSDEETLEIDPDENLPWLDISKLEQWWAGYAHHFQGGRRYFLGKEMSGEHGDFLLRHGYQRQRQYAANLLMLQQNVGARFNTAAPAWRQLRQLSLSF